MTRLALAVAAFAFAAQACGQAVERPANWPAPLLSSTGQCTPVSGRYDDPPVEEILGNEPAYLPTSLADLVAWQLWRKESGPKPIFSRKATATAVHIALSDASVSAFDATGPLATLSSVPGQTIRCEGGYYTFERSLRGNAEGTASDTTWKLQIATTAGGELIVREHRSDFQRTMLVIPTYSVRERWYRFVPAK